MQQCCGGHAQQCVVPMQPAARGCEHGWCGRADAAPTAIRQGRRRRAAAAVLVAPVMTALAVWPKYLQYSVSCIRSATKLGISPAYKVVVVARVMKGIAGFILH
eukprot:1575118-Pleurochrysis_carterae.AAC.1